MKFLLFPARFVLKFTLVIVLVGCVAVQRDSTVMPVSHAEETSGTPVPVAPVPSTDTSPPPIEFPPIKFPQVELSSDLLYNILLAEIAGQRGQFAISADTYLAAARATRDPRLGERAAQIAVLLRDKQKSLEAINLWVELDPESAPARQNLVAFLVRNGQGDAALEHLEKLLTMAAKAPAESAPELSGMMAEPAPGGIADIGLEDGSGSEPVQGFMQIAALLAREEDKKEALRLMAKFAESHKDSADAQFAYGNLALSAGEMKTALEAVERALQLKPDWGNAAVMRARILQAQGDTPAALAYLKAYIDKHSDDYLLRLSYARLLIDAKQPEEASKEFSAVARQLPENAEVLFSLALMSIQIQQLDDAQGYLMQVSKLGKFPSESSYYLGQIAETQKRFKDAITWYQAVDEGDAYLDAQLRIVSLLARQGDIAAARTQLHTIPGDDPQTALLLRVAEADLLREEKEYGKAMEIYDQALNEAPQDETLLYGRAMLAEKMNRLDILEQDLRSILQREPDNARALNALGYTLADRTTRYQEALGFIKRALELNPDDAATLDSVGWVEYRMGNTQEAVKHLKSAYALDANAEIAAHLGEVLWVIGDQDGARKIWDEALKAEPRDEALLKTIERFQAL